MTKISKALMALAPLLTQTVLANPITLLEMSGAKAPFDPNSAAVVMIDFQQEYTTGKLPLFQVDAVIAESRRLLDWARKNQLPVVHVYHRGQAGSIFDLATDAGKPIPQLAPIEGEAVVYKTYPNGFVQTNLEQTLKDLGKKSLIFAGLMSHMCLDASVRAAFDLGFFPLVVASATTTRDLPDVNAGVVKASTLTAATLSSLADLVAAVDSNLDELKARFKVRN